MRVSKKIWNKKGFVYFRKTNGRSWKNKTFLLICYFNKLKVARGGRQANNFFPQSQGLKAQDYLPTTSHPGKETRLSMRKKSQKKISKNHKYLQASSRGDLRHSISILVAGENNFAINKKLFFNLTKYEESQCRDWETNAPAATSSGQRLIWSWKELAKILEEYIKGQRWQRSKFRLFPWKCFQHN